MPEVKQDQAIRIFQELTELKKGMAQVVKLLGNVVKHLEAQVKSPEVKIATREELYAHLLGKEPV